MLLPERFIKKIHSIKSGFRRSRDIRKKRFLGHKKLYKIIHQSKTTKQKKARQSYLLKHKPSRFIKNDKM